MNNFSVTGYICLNPCFNGRYSLRDYTTHTVVYNRRLNPCFNGRYSLSLLAGSFVNTSGGLNPCFNGRYSLRVKTYVPLYSSIWGMFKLLETLLLT